MALLAGCQPQWMFPIPIFKFQISPSPRLLNIRYGKAATAQDFDPAFSNLENTNISNSIQKILSTFSLTILFAPSRLQHQRGGGLLALCMQLFAAGQADLSGQPADACGSLTRRGVFLCHGAFQGISPEDRVRTR